jgi:hypothetical protein
MNKFWEFLCHFFPKFIQFKFHDQIRKHTKIHLILIQWCWHLKQIKSQKKYISNLNIKWKIFSTFRALWLFNFFPQSLKKITVYFCDDSLQSFLKIVCEMWKFKMSKFSLWNFFYCSWKEWRRLILKWIKSYKKL